ncbi:MAG: hypothetical protein Kow0092_32900 [Deferrisomatales bacterium]
MGIQILKYFWVVTLLFVAGAAVLGGRLTGVLLARQLWVGEVETSTQEAAGPAPAARERLEDYRVVQARNIFNAHPKPQIEPPKPPPAVAAQPRPAPAPKVPLNLTLVGTAVVEGGTSFALVESGGDLKVVREGGEVAPGAVLAQVLHDRIRVDHQGTVEEFLLYPPEGDARQARARTRTRSPTRSAPASREEADSDTVRQVAEGRWLIDSREIEQATANMSKLMTQIRVVPNFADGQPDGFKVFAIRPGSLFSKIGLQNGDVIKRVNGIEIQGPEQALEAYQRLKDETSIQIDLTRRNENKTFTYEVR